MEVKENQQQILMQGVDAPSFSDEKNFIEQNENEFVEEKGKQISIQEHIDSHFSKQIVEESLQSAFETQSPKNRRKTTIVSLILLFVNIAFMLFIVTKLIGNMEEGLKFGLLISNRWLKQCAEICRRILMQGTILTGIVSESRWWN